MASIDSLKTRRELVVGDKTYAYYSLRAAEEARTCRRFASADLDEGAAGEPAAQRRRPVGRRATTCKARRRLGRQQGLGRARDQLPPGARADAGLHRRAGGGRPGRHARRHGPARRQPREDQSAEPGRPGHRPLGDGRLLRHRQGLRRERRARVRAQHGALPLPALGLLGLQQLPRRAARHRHLPPGEPGVPGPDRLDQRGRRR